MNLKLNITLMNLFAACCFRRESPHDAVVLHPKHVGKTLDTLPENRYSPGEH